jgi:hypothetical protein
MSMFLRAALIGVCLSFSGCASGAAGGAANCDFTAQVAEELSVIDEGERIGGTIEEAAWTAEQRQSVERAGQLLDSHDRPVTTDDIAILNRALEILASEAVWDRADDRQCSPEDATFSLFCALQRASIETLGQYQHRRVALQEVRFALEEITADRAYEHRLRDFNNDPATTLADVRGVIIVARGRVASRLLAQNAACR